jgi:hypothetical protein
MTPISITKTLIRLYDIGFSALYTKEQNTNSVLPVVFAVSLHKVSKVVVCAPAPSVRHRSWFFFSKPIFEQKKMFDPRVAVSLWYW